MKQGFKLWSFGLIAFFLISLLAACGEAATPVPANTPAAPPTSPSVTTAAALTTVAATSTPAAPTVTTNPATNPTTIAATTAAQATTNPGAANCPASATAANSTPPAVASSPNLLVVGDPSANGALRNPYDGAFDKDGNLYISDIYTHKVYKFDQSLKFKNFVEPVDPKAVEGNPTLLATDTAGNLYVVYDNSQAIKYDVNGHSLGSFGDQSLGTIRSIATDQAGNVYTVTSDAYLVKYDLCGQVTAKFQATKSGDKLAPGEFDASAIVRLDKDGNIYLLEQSSPTSLQKFSPAFKLQQAYDLPKDKDGKVVSIIDMLFDNDGSLLAVSSNRLFKFDQSGKLSSDSPFSGGGLLAVLRRLLLLPDGFLEISSTADGTGKSDRQGKISHPLAPSNATLPGQFSGTTSIAVDPEHNFIVADYNSGRVEKFDQNGKLLLTLDKKAGGPNFHPVRVAVDKSGNIFVAGFEYSQAGLMKFSPDGKVLASFGENGKENNKLYGVNALAVDASGDVYVGDYGRGLVQKFTSNCVYVESYSLKEKEGDSVSSFTMSFGPGGDLYLALYSGGIRILGPDGKSKGLLNSGNTTLGQLKAIDIKIDSAGNFYLLQSSSSDPQITVLDKAGNIKDSFGPKGLAALEFYEPTALAVDNGGYIYVTGGSSDARVYTFLLGDTSIKKGDLWPTGKV